MFSCATHFMFYLKILPYLSYERDHLDVDCTDMDIMPLMVSQGDRMIWLSRQQGSFFKKVKVGYDDGWDGKKLRNGSYKDGKKQMDERSM